MNNYTLTDEELSAAAKQILDIKDRNKREIGNILNHVRGGVEHGRWKDWLSSSGIPYSKAHELMKYAKMYNEKHGIPDLSEPQLLELSRMSTPIREPLEQAMTELKTEHPTISVPTTKMKAVKSMMSGKTEIDVSDLKEVLKQQSVTPTKSPYVDTVDRVKLLGIHLNASARMLWETDNSITELATAILPETSQGRIELDNFHDKFERIYTEMKRLETSNSNSIGELS